MKITLHSLRTRANNTSTTYIYTYRNSTPYQTANLHLSERHFKTEKCYNCDNLGHRANKCKNSTVVIIATVKVTTRAHSKIFLIAVMKTDIVVANDRNATPYKRTTLYKRVCNQQLNLTKKFSPPSKTPSCGYFQAKTWKP